MHETAHPLRRALYTALLRGSRVPGGLTDQRHDLRAERHPTGVSFKDTQPTNGTAKVSIAFSPRVPSSLILQVVPNVEVQSGLPPCPSLRNEPCRLYTASG
jgi:hypothetical protein